MLVSANEMPQTLRVVGKTVELTRRRPPSQVGQRAWPNTGCFYKMCFVRLCSRCVNVCITARDLGATDDSGIQRFKNLFSKHVTKIEHVAIRTCEPCFSHPNMDNALKTLLNPCLIVSCGHVIAMSAFGRKLLFLNRCTTCCWNWVGAEASIPCKVVVHELWSQAYITYPAKPCPRFNVTFDLKRRCPASSRWHRRIPIRTTALHPRTLICWSKFPRNFCSRCSLPDRRLFEGSEYLKSCKQRHTDGFAKTSKNSMPPAK